MFSGHLLCVRCRGGWCSRQTFSLSFSDVPGMPVGWPHCTAGEEGRRLRKGEHLS